eukprot:PITA_34134
MKSRNLWLKAGDRNTAYFHKQAQARKCFNTISEIKEEGDIHKDFDHIKGAAFTHFQKLYSEDKDPSHYPELLENIPAVISQRRNEFLEAKVTKDEVKKALFNMDPNKALGPDGFSARFLQACWSIIEKDLFKMVQKSQNIQKIGGSTNSAFLALIPRKKVPITSTDFGRSLYLQIEPWIAPLVNGRATDFFKASRGLRQGCPLSPLLFVIQASTLSFLLDKKLHEQEINGLRIARGTKNINHALLADDTLLLGPASIPSATKFKEILNEFSEASGSVVNKSKCHIFSWNTSPRLRSAISRCLGFEASSTWSSFKYPGLPLSHKRSSSKDWLPQLEKFKGKIQPWGYS